MSDGARADLLNRACDCSVTDVPALRARLDAGLGAAGIDRPVLDSHPHLFADLPVFLARRHARAMQRVIGAVESVARLSAFRKHVLEDAPAIAQAAPRARGVLFGFDFHIGASGPRLIEINTNAGGALINVEMLRAPQTCCPPAADCLRAAPTAEEREQGIFDMFMRDWRLAQGTRAPRTIAIVDDAPREQYLFPEFLLFQKLFAARGLRAFIVDARELVANADSLLHAGERIDFVYNRSTDFYFEDPRHAALAAAYARGLAVITPHPHAHAVYSNKRNLALLSDAAALRDMGATAADIEVLVRAIPRTLRVAGPAQRWWDERKQWFFKPCSGFGSRGAYRGDKITRRAFAEVMQGNYIAQQIAPPSERWRGVAADAERFKLDIRGYVYDGTAQLLAARLYQGQTTNFRSAGGGFAPVHLVAAQGPRRSPPGCTRAR